MNTAMSKKITSIFLAAAMVTAGVAGFALPVDAAVQFNTFPISFTPELNHDLPLLDARNVTRNGSFSTSASDHSDGVEAFPGDVVEFQIYYHNAGVTEDVATNVIIKALLPGGERFTHEVSATIDSDQTAPVSSADRGGNMDVHIRGSEPQTLSFIQGSTRHFPDRGVHGGTTPSDGDKIVTEGINIGDIKGCFEFSGFVTFRARVGDQEPPSDQRNLLIQKEVRNITDGETVYQDSTFANPNETVRFRITVEATGNASQHNVTVRDVLPIELTFVSGTFRVDGAVSSGENDLLGSGRNLGTFSPGTRKQIEFDARVASAGVFSGTTTLVNTANVRSDEISTRQDTAEVIVQLVGGITFSQRKTAFNLTQGVDATSVSANSGDIIVYTLYFKNTGDQTIEDVVIEDNISDIKELAIVTDSGGATSVNSIIKYPPVDVAPGAEIARTFQVRINDASLFPASSDLIMVNVYGNEVRVPVRKPIVHGKGTPPRTGAGEWFAGIFAGLATAGYWMYRRKKFQFGN